MKAKYLIIAAICFAAGSATSVPVLHYCQSNAIETPNSPDAERDETVVEGIYKEGFRGLKSIINPETQECVGHFVYYKSDEGLKIIFFNTDLEKKNEVSLPNTNEGRVGSAVFNGSDLGVIVYDTPGTFRLYSVSLDGNIVAEKVYTYSHEFGCVEIFPSASDAGYFLLAQVVGDGVTGYQVVKLTSALETVWDQKKYPEDGYLIADAAISLEGKLLVIHRGSKKVNFEGSAKVKPDLVCFDETDGNLLFSSPLYDKDFLALPNQLLIDSDGNLIVVGEYYEGQRVKESNSDGIFLKKLSAAGDELLYNRVSWKDGIQKQLAKTKVKLTGKNKVYLHHLTTTDDGGYQVVAETFSTSAGRKLLSTGLALMGGDAETVSQGINLSTYLAAHATGRYLGEPTSDEAPVTISAQDFLVLHFSKEGELEEVSKIEKEYTKIYVYHPYMYLGGLKLARMINEYGFMDYAFTVKLPESNQHVLISNCAYASDKHFGITTIKKDEEKKVRKIPVKDIGVSADGKKPEIIGVVPGSQGAMVVYYLSKGEKDKQGALHLYKEKIVIDSE